MIDVRVLGPVEASRGAATVVLAGRQPRAVLALLAAHRGTTVPLERMVDGLWPDRRPSDPDAALRVHVARVRAAFGDEGHSVVRTRPHGYLLDLPADRVDLDLFRAALARAEAALADGRPEDAAAGLRAAAGLWRGDPFADVVATGGRWPERDQARRLRRKALVLLVDAELALGRPDAVLPDLRREVAEDPGDDRLWARLVAALGAAGRRAEALEAYQDGRRAAADRGREPGPELRVAQQQVLTGRPVAAAAGGIGPGGRVDEALRRAAEFARGVGAHEEALRCWRAALETSAPDDPGRPGLLLRIADARCQLDGSGQDEGLAARAAFAAAGDVAGVVETDAWLARISLAAGEVPEAVARAEAAAAVAVALPPSEAVVSGLATASGLLSMTGRPAEAAERALGALAAAESIDSDSARAFALDFLAIARQAAGDASCLAYYERGRDLYRRSRGWAPAPYLHNMATTYAEFGLLERSAQLTEESAESALLSGSDRDRRYTDQHRAWDAWWAGRYDDVARIAGRLLAEERDDPCHAGAALLLARLHLVAGRLDEADRAAADAVEVAARSGDPGAEFPALAVHALVSLRLGRTGEARDQARAALAVGGDRSMHVAVGSDLPIAVVELDLDGDVLRTGLPSGWLRAGTALLDGDVSTAVREYRGMGSMPDAAAAAVLAP